MCYSTFSSDAVVCDDNQHALSSNFSSLCSGPVSKREWALLKGKMEVSTAPVKALVYLEGPPVGIDILASCFSIAPSKPEPVSSPISMPAAVLRCTVFCFILRWIVSFFEVPIKEFRYRILNYVVVDLSIKSVIFFRLGYQDYDTINCRSSLLKNLRKWTSREMSLSTQLSTLESRDGQESAAESCIRVYMDGKELWGLGENLLP